MSADPFWMALVIWRTLSHDSCIYVVESYIVEYDYIWQSFVSGS